MNVVVFLAGVEDPKWPLGSGHPAILSPFDESALEVALKLRDRDPATVIGAAVLAEGTDETLARTVAAHRPARLLRVQLPPTASWDLRAVAAILAGTVGALAEAPQLVLLGREFGDRDDGAVPACLAQTLGWPYVGLAQEALVAEGILTLVRERAGFEERIRAAGPVLASVTNDRRNRLRHPLLKNVMAAKREQIAVHSVPQAQARVARAALDPAPPRRAAACRVLRGPSGEQAAELAAYLARWREPA